jgi:hypothetical protein
MPDETTPPKALLDLLAFQKPALRKKLIVIPVTGLTYQWTIALKNEEGRTLYSRITEVQHASVQFDTGLDTDEAGDECNGAWCEGKPGIEESHTTYHVGPFELDVPDDFTNRIVRYQ